jgi:hypothetical protein
MIMKLVGADLTGLVMLIVKGSTVVIMNTTREEMAG